jgi:hypothetical protein
MDFPFGTHEFFYHLSMYHYLFFGVMFVIAICFLILGVIYRKSPMAALLFYTLSFVGLFAGPFVGAYYIEEYLRSSSLQNIDVLRLTYTKAIVVNADIKNNGKAKLKDSYVSFCMVKKNKNSILEFINSIKAAHVQKYTFNLPIDKGASEHIRVVVDTSKLAVPTDYALYYQIKSF